MASTSPDTIVGLILGDASVDLWAMTGAQHAARALAKAGIHTVLPAPDAVAGADSVLVVRGDWVVDATLLGMLKAEKAALLITRHQDRDVCVAAHVPAAQLADARALVDHLAPPPADGDDRVHIIRHDPAQPSIFSPLLRKRFAAVVMPLSDSTLRAAEKATFGASYKGVTDLVTKYVWPVPAMAVTRWCARRAITPNMVTSASLVLVFVAMGCFALGWFSLGLLAAWVMTFLDTVDGKLARVTMTSTKLGNVFDHSIDLIHPPFWWWAWSVGAQASGLIPVGTDIWMWIVVIGYLVLRLQEGIAELFLRLPIHMWRRFDSRFRLVVSRRNPNLLLLTGFTLAGVPEQGMVAVAVWTIISVAVHLVQLIQAGLARRQGPLTSWLAT